jgi:hypothetical protein
MLELIFEHKHIHKNYIIDIKIYRIDKDANYPEGFRYSLVLIKDGKRILGYDNYEGKGHHIHKNGREISYDFTDEWKLVEDFNIDVRKITKGEIE